MPLVYYPLFFSLTGLVQGLTAQETLARAKEKFLPLVGRNLQFWLPVQIVQFEFVPEELQATSLPQPRAPWQLRSSRPAAHTAACRRPHAALCAPPHGQPAPPDAPQVTWVAAFGLVWKVILSSIAGNAKAETACAADCEECLLPEEVAVFKGSADAVVGAVTPVATGSTSAAAEGSAPRDSTSEGGASRLV